MADPISIGIAAASLLLSILTLWITALRPGTVRMTRPTVIFFGPDGKAGFPKVFLRALLYSTARRGQVIESLWVRLHRGGSVQTFGVWVYDEGNDSLVRGSGMKVGYEGVTCTNHFLMPRDGTKYEFHPGVYQLEVYASLVNKTTPLKLMDLNLSLPPEQAEAMQQQAVGVFFDWEPHSGSYQSHADSPRHGGYRFTE